MFDFYNEQMRILEKQMKQAQGTLRNYLAKHNVVDADAGDPAAAPRT